MTRPWLEPLPDAEQQREIDRWAIEDLGMARPDGARRGRPGRRRRAGRPDGPRRRRAAARATTAATAQVAARVLRAAGRDVDVLEAPFDDLSALDGAAVIVDALLGTGFAGTPRAPLDAVIARHQRRGRARGRRRHARGVNGSTGEVEGDAVRAVATATFHAAKPGPVVHPGKAHAGTVHVIDIGIPARRPARRARGWA